MEPVGRAQHDRELCNLLRASIAWPCQGAESGAPQDTTGAGDPGWCFTSLKKKKFVSLNEHKYIDIQVGHFLRSNSHPPVYNRIFTKSETLKPLKNLHLNVEISFKKEKKIHSFQGEGNKTTVLAPAWLVFPEGTLVKDRGTKKKKKKKRSK